MNAYGQFIWSPYLLCLQLHLFVWQKSIYHWKTQNIGLGISSFSFIAKTVAVYLKNLDSCSET